MFIPWAACSDPPLFKADFSLPPDETQWLGDLPFFRTDISDSRTMLRLDAPLDTGSAYLATRQTFEPVLWEWSVHQAFSPSDNNTTFFFLNADTSDISFNSGVRGLALRTGESGTPKHFRLIQFEEGTAKKELITSDIVVQEDTGYRFRVLRTPEGDIHLYISAGLNSTPLLQSAAVSSDDNESMHKGHFGFRSLFTATRSDRFYFGNVLLSELLPKPEVTNIEISQIQDDESATHPPLQGVEFKLTFRVPPDSSGIRKGSFQLNNGIFPDKVECEHPQVCTVRFDGGLESGRHVLNISSYTTIYDQVSEKEQHEVMIFDDVSPGDVIINEVLYRPDEKGNRRFIELMNRSKKVIDLRNWQAGRSLGSPVIADDGDKQNLVFLMPGEKAVISEPGLIVTAPDVLHLHPDGFPSFSRLGDAVYLRSADGSTIDSMSYKPDWGGNRDGVSLERVDPRGASLDPANWKEHPAGHTAGRRNHHFTDRPEPPKAIHAALEDDQTIALTFNRFVEKSSLSYVQLDGRSLAMIEPEEATSDPPATGDRATAAAVFLFRSDRNIEREFKEIQIYGVRDVAGRESEPHSIPLAFCPRPQDLVINEVMYQPITERYSRQPDQSEYIEFYNRSGLALQLKGLHLHDRPDKQGEVQKLKPRRLDTATLPPEAYAVFYADTSLSFNKSRLHNAFSIPDLTGKHFFRIDRLTLGFSTQGDEVFLADRRNAILDSLWFRPSWHNPNVIDVRGISLERINTLGSNHNADNWTSNTHPEGGTPGYRNSVSATPPENKRGVLTLTPNPFSPDSDGIDDHLQIHYSLDEPDFLLHVRVFDRNGRPVRTLTDGQRAGLSGTVIWDGRTNNGVMNRVGIYIIHFEAWNQSNGTKRIFRKVAVLAKPL